MSIAKKCDICGTFYEPYTVKHEEKDTNGLAFLYIDKEGNSYHHRIQDCCPDCMLSIAGHVTRLKDKNKPVDIAEEDWDDLK